MAETAELERRGNAAAESREAFDFRKEDISAENREDEKRKTSPSPLPSPEMISFAPNRDKAGKITPREAEEETGDELIIVPPIRPGFSTARNAPQLATIEPDYYRAEKSAESIGRPSRIDSAKREARNLRSATLGRVGRMFKTRSPNGRGGKTGDPEERSAPTEDRRREKDKTNSLGRMLRLLDKDGAPRKLFSQRRSGSLTGLRKRESTVGNVAAAEGGVTPEAPRSLFERVFGQFRGKNLAAGNAEPDLRAAKSQPKPAASIGTRIVMSLSAARGRPAPTTPAETPVEFSNA